MTPISTMHWSASQARHQSSGNNPGSLEFQSRDRKTSELFCQEESFAGQSRPMWAANAGGCATAGIGCVSSVDMIIDSPSFRRYSAQGRQDLVSAKAL